MFLAIDRVSKFVHVAFFDARSGWGNSDRPISGKSA
jgi:hypothetical protein